MNKIKRSGKLLSAVFAVLFREKKLVLFPLITIGLSVAVLLFFIAPIGLSPDSHPFTSGQHWSNAAHAIFGQFARHNHATGNRMAAWNQKWPVALFFAAYYFTSMFLGIFSNVAFYHEIMQALNGQSVSIRRGYRLAVKRWKAILLWSLFAGLVGYLLNLIEQRLSFLGRITTSFIGISWSVASIFVIPTLVRDSETTNPIKLLRSSANTLKRTWGELVIGLVRIDLPFFFIIMLVLVFPIMSRLTNPGFIWIAFLIIWPCGLICSIVNRVYRCALFIYATEGVVPEPFDKNLLDSAWKVK